ncbi:MAG TPA: HYR domain-containing protein [Gaiellaceae bacterium]
MQRLKKYRPAALGTLALAAAIPLVIVVCAAAPLASAGLDRVSGTLALQGTLTVVSNDAPCRPATLPLLCHENEGRGIVPGLGPIVVTHPYNADPGDPRTDPACFNAVGVHVLGYTARVVVAGKGELELSVHGSEKCLQPPEAIRRTEAFVVTGGSGAYLGASGQGTIEHRWSFVPGGAAGTDLWAGSLTIPGLEFDLTPPTIRGAISKTVRARRGASRVRVTYGVTASDNVDETVTVKCRPRSGSLFKIGRTVVTCTATDSSGNLQTVRFKVTVER